MTKAFRTSAAGEKKTEIWFAAKKQNSQKGGRKRLCLPHPILRLLRIIAAVKVVDS
jgi:hypothetical protein